MKSALIYQSSEFDCGPTSVLNGIRFLFEREEIPPCVLKHIWTMGVDTYSFTGEVGKHGTSRASMRYMADWLNAYRESFKFPLEARFVEGAQTPLAEDAPTWTCLKRGGCAVMRCMTGRIPHYVLLTALESDACALLFDPYEEDMEESDPAQRIVHDQPRRANRRVTIERLNREDDSDYAMGPFEKRENLLLWRTDRSADPEGGATV